MSGTNICNNEERNVETGYECLIKTLNEIDNVRTKMRFINKLFQHVCNSLHKKSIIYLLNEIEKCEKLIIEDSKYAHKKDHIIFFLLESNRKRQKQALEILIFLHEKYNYPIDKRGDSNIQFQNLFIYSPLELAFYYDLEIVFKYLINKLNLDKKEAYILCKKNYLFFRYT